VPAADDDPVGLIPAPRTVHDRLTVRLRHVTDEEHACLERILGLPDRLARPGDLLEVLNLWQRVWSDVAPAPGTRPAPDSLDDLAAQTLEHLATELETLARLAGHPHPVRSTPVPGPGGPLARLRRSDAGRWGVGYVLRGTLVDGRVPAPAAVRRLGLPVGVGVTYLGAEEEDAEAMWADFRRRLDSWALDASAWQRQECLGAALAAFRIVQDWARELVGKPSPRSSPA
jgi:heme oxygenase